MPRNMIRHNPFQAFAPFIDFANDWEGVFGPANGARQERTIKPAMDIVESEEELTISVELPGLKKDDVKLAIENDVLTLSGEKRFENEEKKKDYHRVERSYGTFHRSISLPTQVDAGKAEASFEDGILEIRIPRAETAKPKQIEIG